MDEGSYIKKKVWRIDDDVLKQIVSRQRERQHEMLEQYEIYRQEDIKRRKGL